MRQYFHRYTDDALDLCAVEQQRMADHYAMLTRQQEERENAKARERAAALKRKNTVSRH